MLRAIRLFFKLVLGVALLGLVTAWTGLAVARWSLPASACAVTEPAIDALALERMTDADVIARLGCDGVHKVEIDTPEIRMERVSWQGDAWPYARFEATFINGVLHGTEKRWINLAISAPSG